MPLVFALGEAFRFDWSCEYVFVGGLRRRLEVSHTKLEAIPVHGVAAALVAVELALESGRPSGEHVLKVLARLKSATLQVPDAVTLALTLREDPVADVHRYERLRRKDCQVG